MFAMLLQVGDKQYSFYAIALKDHLLYMNYLVQYFVNFSIFTSLETMETQITSIFYEFMAKTNR